MRYLVLLVSCSLALTSGTSFADSDDEVPSHPSGDGVVIEVSGPAITEAEELVGPQSAVAPSDAKAVPAPVATARVKVTSAEVMRDVDDAQCAWLEVRCYKTDAYGVETGQPCWANMDVGLQKGERAKNARGDDTPFVLREGEKLVVRGRLLRGARTQYKKALAAGAALAAGLMVIPVLAAPAGILGALLGGAALFVDDTTRVVTLASGGVSVDKADIGATVQLDLVSKGRVYVHVTLAIVPEPPRDVGAVLQS